MLNRDLIHSEIGFRENEPKEKIKIQNLNLRGKNTRYHVLTLKDDFLSVGVCAEIPAVSWLTTRR